MSSLFNNILRLSRLLVIYKGDYYDTNDNNHNKADAAQYNLVTHISSIEVVYVLPHSNHC